MALTDKLSAIGNAIRSKTGGTEKLTLDAMVTEIEGITTGADIPEEKFNISGKCDYMFASPSWSWYLEEFGNKIATTDISWANYMFKESTVDSIPFELNFGGRQNWVDGMFQGSKIKEIYKISNLDAYTMKGMFSGCEQLKYLPEFENFNPQFNTEVFNSKACENLFSSCLSLREIPEDFMNKLWSPGIQVGTSSVFSSLGGLFSMDEIRGLNPTSTNTSVNMFQNFGEACCRWKEVFFMVNDDGTPIDVWWSNQTINLTGVGYAPISEIIWDGLNNGITADKEVTDAASYQALKNDADWFTCLAEYSRYNHDSAVNTINSLPNALGSENIIIFLGKSGSQTDGRAINTLTDSELAVAVDKGWTVSFR